MAQIISPFIRYCSTIGVVPSTYEENLTYIECLNFMIKFLNDVVIPAFNENDAAFAALKVDYSQFKEDILDAFNTLQNYVDTYFENLDVQEEINNKLDDMVEAGTIQEIITAYLQVSGMLAYNSVAEMVAAENLINGSKAKTIGYYAAGDGGGAEYYINSTSSNDILSVALDNGLYAHLITDGKTLEAKKLGVHADMVTDDSDTLQAIIDFAYDNNMTVKIKGYVYVDTTINTKGVFIYSDEEKTPGIGHNYVSSTRGNLGYTYLNNTGEGANVTFYEWTHDILKFGSGIISDVANPILECNYADGNFRLKNIVVAGWIRVADQEGIRSVYNSDATYLSGAHMFENVKVCNMGGNGVHLNSLELTNIKGLDSTYNLGYGLYIEGVSGKDTPFEYVTLSDSTLVGNKLGGIYAKNCFRKHVKISNCNFTRSGLYTEFNESVPTTTTDIVGCIKITGNESSSAETRTGLIIDGCFGEEIYKLIHIDTTGLATNNIQITNNTMFKGTKSTTGACLAYIALSYTLGLVWRDNLYNASEGINLVGTNMSNWHVTFIDSSIVNRISPLTATALSDVCELLKDEKSFAYRDNNNVMLQLWGPSASAATAWNTVMLNHLPKPEKLLIFGGSINGTAYNFYLFTDGTLKPTHDIAVGDIVKVNINYVPARV